MFWFVCFVLKYILPICDGPKEDLQESTLYFFLPLYVKRRRSYGKYDLFFSRLDRNQEGIDSYLRNDKSPDCEWQQVKITGTRITLPCKPLYYFGLYVKQISSALTRPTETWLEPASLALTWLRSPQPIMDTTLDLHWGGWVCALTHKTACKNDTRPFTHLMK